MFRPQRKIGAVSRPVMVSNGFSNGHNGNGHHHRKSSDRTDEHFTITLKRLIEDLCREVTTVHKAINLGPGETGTPYLQAATSAISTFVQNAAEILAEKEESIASKVDARHQNEARSLIENMHHALEEINHIGGEVHENGAVFVVDLFSSNKRKEAVRSSKETLEAVTRFLLLCDKLDVFFIIESIDVANSLLNDLRNAKTIAEVEERYSMLLNVLHEVDECTSIRKAEMTCSRSRDDLVAAHSLVKSTCPLVHSITKAAIHHPDIGDARDEVHAEMRRGLDGMRVAISGQPVEGGFASSSLQQYGRLAAELDHFQNRYMMDPSQYRGDVDRADLEEILERIVTGSAAIADERSTRTERKHKIITECNNLRQALQDLLREYERNRGRGEQSEDVDLAMVLVGRRMKDLKRHLRRAIVDNVGDAFLDQDTPLHILIEKASKGDEPGTRDAAGAFMEHARRMVEVARLATEMNSDQEGTRHVKHATELIERLAPQVLKGAFLLCENPQSEVAQEHMEVLRELWKSKVHALTLAVDALLSLDDFIAVSESHIVEDATAGVHAVHENSDKKLDSCAGAIRGRSLRVCEVVEEEMACIEGGGQYVEQVKAATTVLREEIDKFTARSESLIVRLEESELPAQERAAEAEAFADSCNLVLDSVKKIRNALLVNRNPEDVDSDNEYEEDGLTHADQKSTVSDAENQQRLMRRLPEEDKKKIQEQIDVFKITASKFEREVAKWDETGNDIIVLAKHMCMIMMNMTDFTRGRGPLKSTMDVIRAAQEISTAGQKLSVLAREIGEEAEEKNARNEQLKKTKGDLLAYLDKMTLFCQQLNICSRVKADVQQVGEELVVSGLDSAMSLIQTARNLLSAVVSTVKNAYIISTKFRSTRLEWKMSRPRKHPLVSGPVYGNGRNGGEGGGRGGGIVRRASEKRAMPLHALAEFTR